MTWARRASRIRRSRSISTINDTIKVKTAELVAAVRAETHDRSDQLDESISLFSELGAEIYSDRDASLLVSPSPKGILTVQPQISGDASSGIRSVEIFMLGMVCTPYVLATHLTDETETGGLFGFRFG